MTWYYNNEPFTSEMIGDYVGFVYEITDKSNGLKYIGKKGLISRRKLPPLKGKKRRRVKIVETDWQDYYGSSETVKLLVEQNGKENFHREILRLCRKKAEMSYYEAKRQFELDCLLYPEQYYNEFIGCKINRWHLLTKKKN
jgi:hypothetical protein|tara:strand:+ start:246 stop:668 length:423 start_codon:yes stop_codon:yes gene_type:complete